MRKLIDIAAILLFSFIGYQFGHNKATSELTQLKAAEKLVEVAKESPQGQTIWETEEYLLVVFTNDKESQRLAKYIRFLNRK